MESSGQQQQSIKKRRIPLTGLAARVELIDDNVELPPDRSSQAAMRAFTESISDAAKEIEGYLSRHPQVKYDMGRMIHAIDLLQQANNTACAAVKLPHVSKEVDDS